jgi:hypothetical protein
VSRVDRLQHARNRSASIATESNRDHAMMMAWWGALDTLIVIAEELRGLNERLDQMSRSDGKGGAWLRTTGE